MDPRARLPALVGRHPNHGRVPPCWQAFPSAAEQRPFLEAYAEADAGRQLDEAELSSRVIALAAEVAATTPLAHCVWGLWALCALPAAVAATAGDADSAPGGGFSHIEYAERRLRAFDATLLRT